MTYKIIISLAIFTFVFTLFGCKSQTEIAAERGNALAQLKLGKMYDEGDGIEESKVYAYMWMNLAMSQGLGATASKHRDRIAKDMTSSQIEEAEKLSIQCKEKGYKEC